MKNLSLPTWVLMVVLGVGSGVLQAQIPQEFTNLKVLPPETERREVISMMRAFAGALGVRCNHCHVGENPTSLEGYDFASDEKEAKKVARVMMEMTREINHTLLPKTERSELLQVTCMTCHHGLTRPQTLSEVLAHAIAEDGVDAATARYRELRQESYGRGSFDFGEGTLIDLANERIQEHDTRSALVLLELNLEFYPDSWMSHFTLGEIHRHAGNRGEAVKHYDRAVAIAPENRRLSRRVQSLKGQLQP